MGELINRIMYRFIKGLSRIININRFVLQELGKFVEGSAREELVQVTQRCLYHNKN